MLVTDFQINPKHLFERDGCIYLQEHCNEENMDYVVLRVDTTHEKYTGMEPTDGKYCNFLDHAKMKRAGFMLSYTSKILSMELGHANYEFDRDYEYPYMNVKTGVIYPDHKSIPWEEWKYIKTHYGVADNISQVYRKYRKVLKNPDHDIIVQVDEVRKCDQYPRGGWRWHKHGDYIGNQNPQCEYLYDEPKIDKVILYHVCVVKKVM